MEDELLGAGSADSAAGLVFTVTQMLRLRSDQSVGTAACLGARKTNHHKPFRERETGGRREGAQPQLPGTSSPTALSQALASHPSSSSSCSVCS